MARPKKDVSAYFGRKIPGTRLTVVREAGRDSRGRILVKVHCDCEKRKVKVVVLSQVLSGHIKSCGCRKHQLHVEHTQRAVDQLTPTQIRQCFLATVDKSAPKPDLPSDVITAGYYRRAEQLEALPYDVATEIRFHVLRREKYAQIAKKYGLHQAEVAWIYKHVVKPDIEAQRKFIDDQNYLKIRVLGNIAGAKAELEKQKRRRFWANELRTPGSKSRGENQLGEAWDWMMNHPYFIKLNNKEEDLLRWFQLTAAYTFNARRDKRREMGRRQSEKRWNDIEAAA